MQLVIVGTDPDGRSGVVETRALLFADADGAAASEVLWETLETPPDVPAARREPGDAVRSNGVPSTGTRWTLVRFPPGVGYALHRTDTIDYDIVVAGEILLVLEDGDVLLRAGDMVVIPGVLHGWRAGPDGCTLSSALLGLAPVD